MSRHVVFGTGQIGRLVAERLVSLGADVTAVNRSGRGSVIGAQVVAGDATDPVFTTGVCAGRTTLRLIGVVNPAMREYLHTLYQFSERWVVDDTAFRTAFGALATRLDDALATTTAWYRDAGSASRAPASREPNPSSAA